LSPEAKNRRNQSAEHTVEEPRVGGWQTTVFPENFWTARELPQTCSCSAAKRAAEQHQRVATIVRDVDPANWQEASRVLSMELIEEDVLTEKAEDAAWYSELLRKFK
jgi:hypothetical protein